MIFFFIVIILSLYFRAKKVHAPIVVDVPVTNDEASASYLEGRMEDGVIFDDSAVASTSDALTATSTTATTTENLKNTAATTGTTRQ